MAGVTPVGAGEPLFYRVKKVKGRCYFVKEYWDPVLAKKITRSIGPCDLIEQVMKEYKDNKKRGTRGKAPRVVPPPGFEPGSRARKARTHGQGLNTVSPVYIPPPSEERILLWETWCQNRGTSPETCHKYARYLEKPLDLGNRWSAKAYKLYLKWLCEEYGHQESCEQYKRLKTPQAKPDLKVPSLEQILDTITRTGPYRPVYMVLLESGLRLVEAVRLLREYPSLECVELDGFRRCLLGRERGKKRSLWAYHLTPIESSIEDITDRRVTSYAEKYGLVPPKYVRKFVATQMVTLGIPPHVVDFYQGRAPRGVLMQHYAQLLGLADKHYATYARWLREVYGHEG